jgi:hypothetical protein
MNAEADTLTFCSGISGRIKEGRVVGQRRNVLRTIAKV